MTRLDIKQTEALIKYFQFNLNSLDWMDSTNSRIEIENILNAENPNEQTDKEIGSYLPF